MKNKILTSVLVGVSLFFNFPSTNTKVENNNIALAQTQVDPISEVENGNCQNTVEVNYNSQKLVSPDGNTTIYFEGILRRRGQEVTSQLGKYCLSERETPVTNMIVVTNGKTKRISLVEGSGSGGYAVTNPISFSPDGKYLVVHDDIIWDGGDADDLFSFYDLENGYRKLSPFPCRNSYGGGEYKGFISSSEILFECPTIANGTGRVKYEYEVVSLQKSSIRKISKQQADSMKITESYRRVLSPTTIVKKQVFPRR